MKKFRITYRMEVFIDAETKDNALEVFDNAIDVYDLSATPNAEYVELVSIEEEI
jgi:hypothetical protein